jgi:hypothetical protein
MSSKEKKSAIYASILAMNQPETWQTLFWELIRENAYELILSVMDEEVESLCGYR